MLALNQSLHLQQVGKAKNLVQLISYSLVDGNLYIVSTKCTESLRVKIDRFNSTQQSSHAAPSTQ